MIHSAVFDGGVNDILSSINPRVPYAQIYTPSAPVASTNILNSEVEKLLQNRIETPIVETQNAVRDRLLKTIMEAKEHIGKTNYPSNSLERARYIEGIKESLNVAQAYIEENECIYELAQQIKELIEINNQAYAKIIIKSKPFYAGLISGLMNFLDMVIDEVRSKEIAETKISVNISRQINTPDKFYRQNQMVSNASNDYPNSY